MRRAAAPSRLHIGVIGARGIGGTQGGIERYCSEFYAHLPADQFRATIFVRHRSGLEPQHDHIRIVRLPVPRLRSLETLAHSLLAVIAARAMGITTLHVHGIGACLHLWLARAMGMRVIVRHVGADYQRAKWKPLARWILRRGEIACARHAETVVCLSPAIARGLADSTGRTDGIVIPNGVRMPAEAMSVALPGGFDLEPGGYILAVGRIVPEKNFHELIQAFLAADLPPTVKLVLAGKIDYAGSYSDLIDRLCAGHSASIRRLGMVFGSDLWALYRHARLFVLPSAHEGMSFSLLEAGISGTRIVASDIVANREVCRGVGRLYQAGSMPALRESLKVEWARPFDATEQSAQIAYFRQRFDWNRVARSMMPLLSGRRQADERAIATETGARS